MRDKLYRNIAWLLPRQLVMWCTMRVIAYATSGQFSGQNVPKLTAMDAVGRWIGEVR